MKTGIVVVISLLTWGALGCQGDDPAGTGSGGCPDGAEWSGSECVSPVPILVGPDRIGPARVGRAFVVQFSSVGGRGPLGFSVSGSLPSGLGLAETGLLTGTPEEAGEFAFTVVATAADERSGQLELTLVVVDFVCESAESCDGVDNDCDGEVDEEVPGLGEDCGPTEGVCQRGTSICRDGGLVCDGVIHMGEEVCDGVDNDCNGQTDEDLLNACGECGDLPEEVCDGEDNDCDGLTDEGLLNQCGGCGEVPEEVCDGDDNDCDGLTDEGLLNECGECGEVPEEVCDGVDNDCDAEVDEGCPCVEGVREVCGTDVGQCTTGTRLCEGEAWGPCEGSRGPVPEECDGEDNDCDGEPDEGVLNACGECGQVPREVCDGDDNDCDGLTDEGVLNACGECGAVPPEVCDGDDNDCDGETDEGLLNACGECGAVAPETCDGEDNDCDGVIDDSPVDAGGTCGEGPGVCEPGEVVCTDGELDCDGVVLGAVEVCDGEDNDCNGVVDDGIEGVGDACTVPRCGSGLITCEDATLGCDVAAQPPGVQMLAVEGGFVRAYTGTREHAVFDNDQRSYSVLITSDGERVYNVAYGIDGEWFSGWTVRTFVPGPTGLALQDTVEIRVDWEESGAPRAGFAGVAAKEGLVYATQVASGGGDPTIWVIDPAAETAEVYASWGEERQTQEGSAEYDFTQGRFWTIQWFVPDPEVFRYSGQEGLHPSEEQASFKLDIPEGNDERVGTIASDGVHLYGATYSSQQGDLELPLWRFGSGLAGTLPGASPTMFALIRAAASMTYHMDGNIYVPLHGDVDMVQRVPATVGGGDEVCDGLDNDCDGEADEGVCRSVDLDLVDGEADPISGEFEVDVRYGVLNRGESATGDYRDALFLADPAAPTQVVAVLGTRQRPELPAFAYEEFTETVELPEETESGDWLLVVVVDQGNEVGDQDRTNNFVRIPFAFFNPDECEADRYEPNDDWDGAQGVNHVGVHQDLRLCPGDEDWFAVDVRRFQGQRVTLDSDPDTNPTFVVYDRDENEIARPRGQFGRTTIARFSNNSGETRRFWFKVFHQENAPVDYTLDVSD